MGSIEVLGRNSSKPEIRIFPQRFLAAPPTCCLRVSIFCVRRALRRNAATGCSHNEEFSIGVVVRTYCRQALASAQSRFQRANQNSIVTVTSKLQSLSSFSRSRDTL